LLSDSSLAHKFDFKITPNNPHIKRMGGARVPVDWLGRLNELTALPITMSFVAVGRFVEELISTPSCFREATVARQSSLGKAINFAGAIRDHCEHDERCRDGCHREL
jgi:hypothetical protein